MKLSCLLLLSSILFIGCSSDDDNTPEGPVTGEIYLPLSAGNYWTYDVESATNAGRDSLYIANDTVIAGNSYKKMKTRDLAFGFYSASLQNNGVRYDDGAVKVSGNAVLDFGQPFPINLPITDFVMLRENASDDQQLSLVTGTIEEDFGAFPLTIDYKLKSTAQATLPSYTTPNGDTYSDVKSVQMVLNVSVETINDDFGFPVTIQILAPQDVVVSTSYFAKDIGMVYTHTVLSYELEDLPGGSLPIPSSATELQEEFLDMYVVE